MHQPFVIFRNNRESLAPIESPAYDPNIESKIGILQGFNTFLIVNIK